MADADLPHRLIEDELWAMRSTELYRMERECYAKMREAQTREEAKVYLDNALSIIRHLKECFGH